MSAPFSHDLLNHWVSFAQIRGCIHTHCYLQGTWEITPDFHQENRGVFHLLRKGQCQIITEDNKHYTMVEGDLLFFPKGIEHAVKSRAFNKAIRYPINTETQPFFYLKKTESPRTDIELLCGYFDYSPQSVLINELPSVIQVSVGRGRLEQLSQLIYAEMDTCGMAQKVAVDSLLNYLFIVVLRHFLSQNEHLSRLLTIKDEAIIKLIQAMIASPDEGWTLEKMSAYCFLSRAVFAKRFHQSVGYTPNRFLTQIRISIAMVLIKTTSRTLLDIAVSVGFQSESYFGKTFKSYTGITPGDYRLSK